MSYGAAGYLSAQYDLALNIATEYHGDQKDKAGRLYILHPIRVAHMVMIERRKLSDVHDTRMLAPTALLHDVLEDTTCTTAILARRGVDPVTISNVDLLTKRRKDTYRKFVQRICDSGNSGAILVKWWDIEDNTKQWREALLKPEQRSTNLSKYPEARTQLSNALTLLREIPASPEILLQRTK